MRIGVVALVFLSGCPVCCEQEVEIVSGGDRAISAGEVVQLRAHADGWSLGPDDCGGFWYVNGFLGGDADVGTIDTCGLYRAPARFPPQLAEIWIEASEHPLFEYGCSDCCTPAYGVFAIVRDDAP